MEKGKKNEPLSIFDIGELVKKPYLLEVETSAITGRKLPTLRNDRFLRRGIPYLKVGKRSIRYKTADVLAYMEKTRISFGEEGPCHAK